MAAATTAPNSSRSDQRSCPRPPHWAEAKPIAASAPTAAMTQNVTGGRSWPRRTAIVAVAAGSSAMTTAPWLAGAVVSAYEVSSGKPTTTPPPTTASRAHCRPAGAAGGSAASAPAARTAATTARPDPMNSGDRPPTATRVNGTVNEKAATPSRPHSRPADGRGRYHCAAERE